MSEYSLLVTNTIGLVLILGVIAGYIAEKYNFPKMVPLLLIGILISILNPGLLLNFHNDQFKETALFIAELGLLCVLYQEGMHLSIKHLKMNILPIILLAFIGTVLTASIVGITNSLLIVTLTEREFQYIILGNLLFAAIVVPTDPAATFSILRQSGERVKKNLETILAGESAFNDVIAILLVIIILLPQVEAGNTTLDLSILVILLAIWQLVGGVIFGVLISMATIALMSKYNKQNELTSLSLGSVLVIFSVSQFLSISGAIAALTAGVVMVNPHYVGMKRWYTDSFFAPFWDKMIYLIEIFAFTFLGTLFKLDNFGIFFRVGLILSLIVILARIASVYLVTLPLDRGEKTSDILSHKERLFIAFAGFKGLTTGVLALISFITLANVEGPISVEEAAFSDVILYGSVSLIIITGTIQGLILPKLSTKMEVYDRSTSVIA